MTTTRLSRNSASASWIQRYSGTRITRTSSRTICSCGTKVPTRAIQKTPRISWSKKRICSSTPRTRRTRSGSRTCSAPLEAMMQVHKIAIKFFIDDDSKLAGVEFVPIFHSWIQTQLVPDHMLVDVADYAHVQD